MILKDTDMINKCYDCGYQWNVDDINEACPNCNSLDNTNIDNNEIESGQHNFEDEDCEDTTIEIENETEEKRKSEVITHGKFERKI